MRGTVQSRGLVPFYPPYYSFAIGTQNTIALGFFRTGDCIDIALIHFMHQAASQLQEEQAITAGLYEQQRTMFQELQHRVAQQHAVRRGSAESAEKEGWRFTRRGRRAR